jgi:hypothetical protein
MLAGQFSVSLLDLVLGGGLGNAKNLIVVSELHGHFSSPRSAA